MRPIAPIVSALLVLGSFALAAAQAPVDGSFSYQGELRDSAVPIHGSVDFVFNLYDADVGGTEIGSAVALADVELVDGVFTVQLDFGADAFDGTERWLSIRVRNPHDPTDSTPYVALDPRQPVSAAPYANYSLNDATWQASGAAIRNRESSIFVGINRDTRLTPAEYFGVRAPVNSGYGGMYIDTEGADGWPFYGFRTSSSVAWQYMNGSTGAWHLSLGGFDRIGVEPNGNVGIGVYPPSEKLSVAGIVQSTLGGFRFPDGTLQTTAAFDVGPVPDGHSLDASDGSPVDVVSVDAAGDVTMTRDAQVDRDLTVGSDLSVGAAALVGSNFQAQGNATVLGRLGAGVSSPSYRFHVDDSSTTANIAHIRRSAVAASGADVLEVQAEVGSDVSSQLIEAQLGASDIKFRVWADGDVTLDGLVTVGGADFAELVHVPRGAGSVEPGDVMVIDPGSRRGFAKSTRAHSTLVAGVYSTKPGVLGTETDWDQYEFQKLALAPGEEAPASKTLDLAREVDEVPLAMVGIVPCKVTDSGGRVRVGDLLVTSDVPGHAMRADAPKSGTIVGKALEEMSGSSDVILVLVTLQ